MMNYPRARAYRECEEVNVADGSDGGSDFADMPYAPIRQREIWKTSEVAAFALVRDIVARGLQAGDRLPLEAELLEQYAVSRESMREALRLLEAQGIVHIRRGPGGGPIVGRAESANLARTMTLYFHLSGATYDELIRSWEELEPASAGRAATNPDRGRVAELMDPHTQTFDAAGDPVKYMAHSNGLHFAVLELDDNRVLRMITAAVGDIIRTHVLLRIDPFEIRELIDCDHHAIAAAILAGDSVAAHDAMRAHVVGLEPVYRAHWDGSMSDLVEWK
jgi:GntR family transcriptional regulator, transcriptional repressor for pyruvate dehydrogenase complex